MTGEWAELEYACCTGKEAICAFTTSSGKGRVMFRREIRKLGILALAVFLGFNTSCHKLSIPSNQQKEEAVFKNIQKIEDITLSLSSRFIPLENYPSAGLAVYNRDGKTEFIYLNSDDYLVTAEFDGKNNKITETVLPEHGFTVDNRNYRMASAQTNEGIVAIAEKYGQDKEFHPEVYMIKQGKANKIGELPSDARLISIIQNEKSKDNARVCYFNGEAIMSAEITNKGVSKPEKEFEITIGNVGNLIPLDENTIIYSKDFNTYCMVRGEDGNKNGKWGQKAKIEGMDLIHPVQDKQGNLYALTRDSKDDDKTYLVKISSDGNLEQSVVLKDCNYSARLFRADKSAIIVPYIDFEPHGRHQAAQGALAILIQKPTGKIVYEFQDYCYIPDSLRLAISGNKIYSPARGGLLESTLTLDTGYTK